MGGNGGQPYFFMVRAVVLCGLTLQSRRLEKPKRSELPLNNLNQDNQETMLLVLPLRALTSAVMIIGGGCGVNQVAHLEPLFPQNGPALQWLPLLRCSCSCSWLLSGTSTCARKWLLQTPAPWTPPAQYMCSPSSAKAPRPLCGFWLTSASSFKSRFTNLFQKGLFSIVETQATSNHLLADPVPVSLPTL